MNVKEKGQPGIYTKVYGFVYEDAETITRKKSDGTDFNVVQFTVGYETGSVDSKKVPIVKFMRCESSQDKIVSLGGLPKKGDRLEVGGPLRVDYNKENEKTFVTLRVNEMNKD